MNRYKKIFAQLHHNKSGALIPFITIGDPDPMIFIEIINVLIQSGADSLELGIPFSDPVSDGPSIQKSIHRSFKSGINFINCFKLIEIIRNNYPYIPIGLLVYANLIFKNGIHKFYKNCHRLKIDSVLIPDLPIEESDIFYTTANYYKISHIFVCPPNATYDLIRKIILKYNGGYIYLISRPGVTGINKNKFDYTILNILIQEIQQHKNILPILQGFGVYTSTQAKTSIQSGTSGVILGSIIADCIEKYSENKKLLFSELKKLIQSMKLSMQL